VQIIVKCYHDLQTKERNLHCDCPKRFRLAVDFGCTCDTERPMFCVLVTLRGPWFVYWYLVSLSERVREKGQEGAAGEEGGVWRRGMRFDGWGYEDRNEVDSTSAREQVHTLSLTNTFYEVPVTAKALQDARAKWSLAAAHRIFLPLWIINLLDDS